MLGKINIKRQFNDVVLTVLIIIFIIIWGAVCQCERQCNIVRWGLQCQTTQNSYCDSATYYITAGTLFKLSQFPVCKVALITNHRIAEKIRSGHTHKSMSGSALHIISPHQMLVIIAFSYSDFGLEGFFRVDTWICIINK